MTLKIRIDVSDKESGDDLETLEYEVGVIEVIEGLKTGKHRMPAGAALAQWTSDVTQHIGDGLYDFLIRYIEKHVNDDA